MTVKQDVVKELDSLIAEGERCCTSFRGDGMGGVWSSIAEHELWAFAVRTYAAVERIAGRNSEYYRSLPDDPAEALLAGSYGPLPLSAMFGALSALRQAVDSGFLVSLEARIRAHIHDDFLEQAKDLIDSKYHVAAMVLIGGVLEDHLNKLCTKNGFTIAGNGSVSKYNDACHKGNAYDKPTWRRIQSVGDLRNDAAHGQGARVNAPDVDDAYKFVGRFIVDHPA